MAALAQSTNPSEKAAIVEAVTPIIHDHNHQDASFGNVFPPTSHFIVHPEWTSEGGNKRPSEAMERPAWSWEQPKYRQNIKSRSADQTPSYDSKEEQFAQPMSSDMPYKLQPRHQYTPWVTATMAPAEGRHTPAMVPRENKLECFTRLETEHVRLVTTMQERERLQFHIHY